MGEAAGQSKLASQILSANTPPGTEKKGGKDRREGGEKDLGRGIQLIMKLPARVSEKIRTGCQALNCQTKVLFINHVFGNKGLSWRDGLGVKSMYQFSRGPEFHSQHPCQAAHQHFG